MTGAEAVARYRAGWLLAGADLCGADLCGAQLRGANLSGANLSGANLSGSGLLEACLLEACLLEASLYEAYLYGADLRGADLRGADLAWANLVGADLRESILPDGRTLDQWRADPLAGLCDDPESVARAVEAWGGRTWGDCPLHAGLGVDGLGDVPEDRRALAATFVALLDGGHLPRPEVTL